MGRSARSASGSRPTWLQCAALHLVDLGLIDVQVRDATRIAREFVRVAGHAIIEARADRNQKIAVIDRIVGKRGAVHAEHAHRQRIGGVDGADAHQRGDHRDTEPLREFGQRTWRHRH